MIPLDKLPYCRHSIHLVGFLPDSVGLEPRLVEECAEDAEKSIAHHRKREKKDTFGPVKIYKGCEFDGFVGEEVFAVLTGLKRKRWIPHPVADFIIGYRKFDVKACGYDDRMAILPCTRAIYDYYIFAQVDPEGLRGRLWAVVPRSRMVLGKLKTYRNSTARSWEIPLRELRDEFKPGVCVICANIPRD